MATDFSTFEFSSTIFKVIPDRYSKYLAIELRNSITREVNFVVIDTQTQAIILPETGFEEAWRVGLSAIESNILLLHTYTNTKLPDKKGIFAVNFLTQEVIWEQNEWRFIALYSYQLPDTTKNISVIEAVKITDYTQQTNFFEMETGRNIAIIPTHLTPFYPKNQQEAYFYSSNHEYFNSFQKLVTPHLNANTTFQNNFHGFDYVEIDNQFVILCYYENAPNMQDIQTIETTPITTKLKSHLFIFSVQGDKLFSKEISNTLTLDLIGGSLFVFGDVICVLKNKNTLTLFNVSAIIKK
jgi:hypothetical protein